MKQAWYRPIHLPGCGQAPAVPPADVSKLSFLSSMRLLFQLTPRADGTEAAMQWDHLETFCREKKAFGTLDSAEARREDNNSGT